MLSTSQTEQGTMQQLRTTNTVKEDKDDLYQWYMERINHYWGHPGFMNLMERASECAAKSGKPPPPWESLESWTEYLEKEASNDKLELAAKIL
jgi:hypothetical protein